MPENPASYRVVRTKSYLFNKAGISTNARKGERTHLLGLLRIRMGLLKEQGLTPEEIYSALEQWIANHETITSEGSRP
ncbi:hypothetical protein [Klebsiella pneumoniae]|uniref:hypothetical protein n=1 Tax=Klebsiella pneumoniae TaxID=573 RepID=UPI0031D2E36E